MTKQENVNALSIQEARREGAEAMRAAIVKALASLWDGGAANIAANVKLPDTF